MNRTQNRLAFDIRVSARRKNEIVQCKRKITVDTALRLAKHFAVSPQFWPGLQIDNDIYVAEDQIAEHLNNEIQTYQPAA